MTENPPKVAIIIPNYNKAKYLPDCIISAVRQSYKNLEVIVVDDCSSDNSCKIVRRLMKKYSNLKLYRLAKNRGVSYARNYGARKTNADYLVFLDSDDVYINNEKIENEARIASSNKVSFSQWVPMDVRGVILPYKRFSRNPLFGPLAICKIMSVNLPPQKQLRGYMIPSGLFDKIGGYNTKMNYYEDFDLQCRLALNAKFVYTRSLGEAYRLNTGGLSNRTIKDADDKIKEIRNKYISSLNIIQRIILLLYLSR